MATDRRAILQKAQALASKGQLDGAISEYTKLLSNSSADATVHNSIGDLQLKRNAPKEAVASYMQAAEAFRAQAEPLKAIAAYKKVLKLDPARAQVYQHLGDLNAERGLVSSAVADYSTLAKLYVKEGKVKPALEVYRKIIKQDPANVIAQQQITELCAKQGLDVDKFLSAADDAPGGAAGKGGASAPSTPPAAEAPSQSQPTGRESSLADATRKMNEGDFAGADDLLTQLLNQHPGDPEICQLLARLHLKRGDTSMAQNEYQFLAGAALRADDFTLAENLVNEYLEVHATCAPMLEMLGEIYEKRGNTETAIMNYGKALQVLLENPDPDLPTLPEELFSRIKELDPSHFLVGQFTAAFEDQEPAGSADEVGGLGLGAPTPVETEPSPAAPEATAAPPIEASEPRIPAPPEADSAPPTQAASPAQTAVGAASTETGAGAIETRFTLGQAYKDMGLLSEAIEEFRHTVTDPGLFLDSCIQLADCLRDRGLNRRAIACLEHALADARCVGDLSLTVRYELGLLFEAEGLFDRALNMYETIPTHRDVDKRIEWIKGGGQKETVPPGGSETPVGAGRTVSDGPAPGRKKRRISYL